MAAQKKAPAAPATSPGTSKQKGSARTLGPVRLEHRYPLQAAADALALMRWDHDQAGGHHQLAEALGCDRAELLAHRWRLQIIEPLELEVGHG